MASVAPPTFQRPAVPSPPSYLAVIASKCDARAGSGRPLPQKVARHSRMVASKRRNLSGDTWAGPSRPRTMAVGERRGADRFRVATSSTMRGATGSGLPLSVAARVGLDSTTFFLIFSRKIVAVGDIVICRYSYYPSGMLSCPPL